MFSGRHDLPKDENGAYFLDRNPRPFNVILDFLRSPKKYTTEAIVDKELLMLVQIEAEFFGMKENMFPAPPPPPPPFVPAAPQTLRGKHGHEINVTQGVDELWYMSIVHSFNKVWHMAIADSDPCQVQVCKDGCGGPENNLSYGVKNFTTGRAIGPKQPTMPAGSHCSMCGKCQ